MQYDRHETDLYILPETMKEEGQIETILKYKFPSWHWHKSVSDVKGQSWYNQEFIEIPFGIDLKEEIISLMKG